MLHGNRVAVAREKRVNITKGGLYIPETAVNTNSYGAVVLVGDEVVKDILVGDQTYVPKYGGVVVKQRIAGDTYILEILHVLDLYLTYRTGEELDLEVGGEDVKI
jgi:co-chaperonin GroES (HSP10)